MKSEKRFQLILSEEEFETLKEESSKRNLSASEFLRRSLYSEIYKKTDLERILALKRISSNYIE
ncbi:MAG: CopG family transcriptional regulator [Leptospiraceae bacterium]|nr:CopG family transcriptional regulator [Leptospiraceae bacterium]